MTGCCLLLSVVHRLDRWIGGKSSWEDGLPHAPQATSHTQHLLVTFGWSAGEDIDGLIGLAQMDSRHGRFFLAMCAEVQRFGSHCL